MDVEPGSELQGRLLVAEPGLRDPNFHRTVVYVVEHSAEGGALGIVLNRPGEVAVRDAVPEWAPYIANEHVYVGGPVTPEGALCLARAKQGCRFVATDVAAAPMQPISPTVGVADLHGDPADLPGTVGALRLFAGYAGWSPGQLEAELVAGGWFVLRSRDGDLFTDHPEDLWRAVLRRQKGELRSRAFFPEDPTVN